MADVFISYVEEDSDAAAEIARALTDAGISSWRYETDALAGEDYLLQTRKQIESARVFLVLISPSSLGAVQVYREVVRAHECGRAFVPVLRELSYHEFGRRNPEWEQAMGGATAVAAPSGDVSDQVQRIVDGVQRLLSRDSRNLPFRRKKWSMRRVRRILWHATWAVTLIGVTVGGGLMVLHSRANAARARAASAMESGDLAGVAAALDWVIDWFPNDLEARILRARAYGKLGDDARAKVELDEVLRRAPAHVEALGYRATAYEGLHQLADANKDYQAALKMDPQHWSYWYRLGRNYAEMGNPEQAEAAFSTVIANDPQDVDALLRRAMARGQQKKFAEAHTDVDAAQRLHAEYGEARGVRGLILAAEGKYDPAEVELSAALSMSLSPEARPGIEQALKQVRAQLPSVGDLQTIVDYGVEQAGRRGIAISASFTVRGFAGQECSAMATILDEQDKPIPAATAEFATGDGYLGGFMPFTPRTSPASVRDLRIFIAYGEFPTRPGRTLYHFDFAIFDPQFRRVSDRCRGEVEIVYNPP